MPKATLHSLILIESEQFNVRIISLKVHFKLALFCKSLRPINYGDIAYGKVALKRTACILLTAS